MSNESTVWSPRAYGISAIAALFVALVLGALPARAQIVITLPGLDMEGSYILTAAPNTITNITGPITGTSNVLDIRGEGQVNSSAINSLQGGIEIRRATFRLHGEGRMSNRNFIHIRGGTFIIDNTGEDEIDYISNDSPVTLYAGNWVFLGSTEATGDTEENFGRLDLNWGANEISLFKQNTVGKMSLRPITDFRRSSNSTLNLISNRPWGFGEDDIVRFYWDSSIEWGNSITTANGIAPWATVEGLNWGRIMTSGNFRYITALNNYNTGTPNTWQPTDNVSIEGGVGQTILVNTVINSLRFADSSQSSTLFLNGRTLTISSGGILAASTGLTPPALIAGTGTLATNSSFYVHTYKDLEIQGTVRFVSFNDLIKTGPSSLILNSTAQHDFNRLTINQGQIWLDQGTIRIRNGITVGDRAGRDALILPANRTNPIIASDGSPPSISLNGNPYGPTHEGAILQLLGNTQQALRSLSVSGRGILDFSGGAPGSENILYLDQLFISGEARLIIRNWNDQADYLLVRRSWGDIHVPPILGQIHFEGYGPAQWHRHYLDGNAYNGYWQITPMPEPSTYGAILGTCALALIAWRQKQQRRRTKGKRHAS